MPRMEGYLGNACAPYILTSPIWPPSIFGPMTKGAFWHTIIDKDGGKGQVKTIIVTYTFSTTAVV